MGKIPRTVVRARYEPYTTMRRILENQAEKKTQIVSNSGVGVTAVGTMINLSNNVIQGDDLNNRSGDKINVVGTRLLMRAVALVNSQTIRFILVSDNFNQGTTPAVTDVLNAASFIGNYNQTLVVQQKRFTIHGDWAVDVNINGESVKSLVKTFGRTGAIFYNGATAVASSNGRRACFLLVIGSSATGTYDFSWEVRYTDM